MNFLNYVMKIIAFEGIFVFCVFGVKEKAFNWFSFTGIFLSADNIFFPPVVFKVSRMWYWFKENKVVFFFFFKEVMKGYTDV